MFFAEYAAGLRERSREKLETVFDVFEQVCHPRQLGQVRKGFGCRVAKQLGKGNAPVLHRLMRHSSMQVTMDYYASVDDALQDAIRNLK